MSERELMAAVLGALAGGVIAIFIAMFISEDFEKRRCEALEKRLGTVNLAYSSKGCVLAEDL